MKNTILIKEAIENLKNSYSPYSKFAVSCVILLKDGKIINGVNVENASFGGTICAERSAIVNLISQGLKISDVKKVVIVSSGKDKCIPCCICRQIMLEFLDLKTPIIMANQNLEYDEVTLGELIPFPFDPKNL